MDSKNFAIGILSTTAVILLVGLLVVQTQPQSVQANSMNAQGGDYLLITGQLQRNQEVLYVVDGASQKMIVYQYEINRKTIEPKHAENLSKYNNAKDDDSKTNSRSRRGRSRRR
ncbi:MAG: hypothetical protein ACE5GE_09195 [Phycisphaerae bacterium]